VVEPSPLLFGRVKSGALVPTEGGSVSGAANAGCEPRVDVLVDIKPAPANVIEDLKKVLRVEESWEFCADICIVENALHDAKTVTHQAHVIVLQRNILYCPN